jgi:Adenylate cyclase, family 3 (some proteins contain HAMP domain)
MMNIKEYSSASSPYEIMVHLTDKIIKGELVTFKSLRAYCSILPDSPRTEAIFRRAFELQKRLYWGFFRDISPSAYPKVWSKVVVPDQRYHFAGDIKRMAMIPDVYMAMLDIHGYTRFCQKHRHNMSMLDLLDKVMQQDLPAIAAKYGVVSRRASGDEILLLGGSAAELFETVYQIVRALAKGADGKPMDEGTAANALPDFQVSAGMAGGAKYAQLVITRDGDLSGTIVNTAARLQARANKIAPDKTKILLTSVTFQKLKTLPSTARFGFLSAVDFFDTGMVEFKGVSVPVFDTVFLDREAHRLEYRDRMGSLYEALDQGLWSSRIFSDSLNLLARITSLSSGSLVDEATGREIDASDPISLMQRIKKAQSFFTAGRYEQAVAEFTSLVDALCLSKGRDVVAAEYLAHVRDNYQRVVGRFVEKLDSSIDEKIDSIFIDPKDRANYRTLERHHEMFSNVRDAARLKVADRRGLWAKTVESEAESLKVNIQSKK